MGVLSGGARRVCSEQRHSMFPAKVFIMAAFLIAGIVPAAGQNMALPGKFDVDANGAATYRIPMVIPAGTAGMSPPLALSYNSHQGNGMLGVGWSLSGLQSITRCPRTVAQDGVRGSVNYDADDRFCLDGQRLVAINGSYGADGTEYRTEIESFAKIISRGSAGTGPAWFEVRTKSGQDHGVRQHCGFTDPGPGQDNGT